MLLFRVFFVLLAIGVVILDPAGGDILETIPFDLRAPVLEALLAVFLFAGALQVRNDGAILNNIRLVMLAALTTGLSTVGVAWLFWWLGGRLGVDLSWTWCLLFGALTAPVDPLATSRMMRNAGADESLTGKAAVESVWSGIFCVILFLALLQSATGEAGRAAPLSGLMMQQTIGAALLGLMTGTLLVFVIRLGDRPALSIVLSVATLAGGIALAFAMELAAPVAAAIGGLLPAMCRGRWAMEPSRRERLSRFWTWAAEAAVALLLFWLALEMTTESISMKQATIGVLLIPVVLVVRMVSVAVPVRISVLRAQLTHEVVRIMVWGGVRSALAITLVLMVPESPERRLMLTAVFVILAFSLLIQGPSYHLKATIERPLAGTSGERES